MSYYDDRGLRRYLSELLAEHARVTARQAEQTDRCLNDRVQELSGRLEALSDKLDALLGLRQIDAELEALAPVQTAREAAALVVHAVVYDRPVPTTDLEDVDEYWLVPAAQALVGARDGQVDRTAAEVAAARDPQRTATLLATVLTLVGHPEAAAPWLDTAFLPGTDTRWGSPSGMTAPAQVTVATRALWDAAASGLLDLPGVQLIQRRLGTMARVSPLRNTVLSLAPGARGHRSQAESLEAWTAWVTTAGPALDSPTDGAGTARDALLAVVRSLTAEGAPDERDLMERAAQLATGAGHTPDPSRVWNAPTVPLANALASALRSTEPNHARLVTPAVLPLVRQRVDDLVQDLERAPAPTQTVTMGTQSWTITGDEDPSALADELVGEAAPTQRLPVLGALAAATVAFLVLAVAVSPGWFVAAAITGIAAVVEFTVRQDKANQHQENMDAQKTRLITRLREARAQLATDATDRAATLTAARTLSAALADRPELA